MITNGRIREWAQQQGSTTAAQRNYTFAYDRNSQLTDAIVKDASANVIKAWSWQIAERAQSRRDEDEGNKPANGGAVGNPAGNRLRESVATASTYTWSLARRLRLRL